MRCVLLLSATVLLTGCASLTGPAVRLQNAERLMEREDFPQAARAAPDWVEEALLTVNELEAEVEAR